MIFSSGGRLLSRSARSAFQKNVIWVNYNGRAALRHEQPAPLGGNAGISGGLGLLRGYLTYNGGGKQLVSNAYMSNLKSALANPRIRRLFSSERPGKKNYENYYPKDKKEILKGNDQKSGSKGAGDQGNTQGNFSKQIQDLITPLLFMGFIFISLFLTPQKQKQAITTLRAIALLVLNRWIGCLRSLCLCITVYSLNYIVVDFQHVITFLLLALEKCCCITHHDS